MKKSTLKKLLAGLLAALFVFALAGCGGESGTGQDESLQKVLDAGKLVLGLDDSFPPMGFRDENGEIVGFDIDVAREVCARLGVELVTQTIDWDEKEDDLNEGRIDCIWNGFSVTPARAEAMALSEPYMKNELIFLVPGDSEIMSIGNLKGKRIGFQSGSTAEDVFKESEYYSETTPVSYDTVLDLFEKLDQGEVDVAFVDSVAAYYYILSKDVQYFILPDSLDEEEYAVGFRKGDIKLRDRVQEIMTEMKADGTLGTISKKWFGSDITTVK